MDNRNTKARHFLLPFATVAATLTAVWIWAAAYNHVPCISDCGETFIAQLYARNFRITQHHLR
jgi:hypothetical protein